MRVTLLLLSLCGMFIGASCLAPPSALAQTVHPSSPQQTFAYDKDLMRLSELMGALHYLRPLCNEPDGEEWRNRMQALLDSEAEPVVRRNQLAGAFNAGYESYQQTYKRCTESAHIVMRRFLSEGSQLSRTLTERFGH